MISYFEYPLPKARGVSNTVSYAYFHYSKWNFHNMKFYIPN